MGQSYGPKLVTDSLILCLDAHDANSYAGEPVTNLVSSSAVDFSVRSSYTGNTFSQVADSESPSGYACEMSYTGTVNSASRCRFGAADDIPTSGSGFVSIWAKKSAGTSATMRPKVYTGYTWYDLDPLDGGSIYFTSEYRPFGKAVTFGTSSSGPNPGFSMTHAGGSTSSDRTKWIKPQVTTLSYNVPFANLSRSATNGWADLSGNDNHGTLTNMVGTGASHYKDGQVIKPLANSYLDFDGSNDEIDVGSLGTSGEFSESTISIWLQKGSQASNYGNPFDCNYGATDVNKGPRMEVDIGGSIVRVYMGTDGGSYTSISFGSLSNDEWYNLVLTVSPNGSSQDLKAYTNGALITSSTSSSGFVWDGDMADLYLGVGFTSARHFTGKIAAFQIYNKTLTAAQIKANFNAHRRRFGV